MKTKIYRANDRGIANHGWLKANFSFSFANYFNPDQVNFGALRVLNDDFIEGGMGFGTHPHDNMEIITIPLKGTMKHRDSMSNKWIPLNTGEVQVMSAGKGIQHSEMNNDPNVEVNLFQIWILPNKKNIEPRYDQKSFDISERNEELQTLVSWEDEKIDESLTINQDARISRVDLDKGNSFKYSVKNENYGVYLMVIEGEVSIQNENLNKRDAIGIEQTNNFELISRSKSQLLLIEVPMLF